MILLASLFMVICGAAMGRLMWLMDGKPPLDRPRWLPRRAQRGH